MASWGSHLANENGKRSRQFSLAALFLVQTLCGVAFMIWAELGLGFFVVVVGFSASVTGLVAGTIHIARHMQNNVIVKPAIWIGIPFSALFLITNFLSLLSTTFLGWP